MKDVEYIIDFAVNLGGRMLTCGANLERVNDTINRVCYSYHLEDISLFSLSSIIQLGARSEDGDYAYRQIAVQGTDIHLEKLNRLNQLSRRVCSETPAPQKLQGMIQEAENVEEYPLWLILLGRMIAMTSMGFLCGGTIGDVICSDLICFVLFFMIRALTRANLNHVIVNMVCMLFAGSVSIVLYRFGPGDQFWMIIITCAMMIIPGIPLVNAFRNLLCGNEMNGILEMLKAAIEALAIVTGLVASIFIFGGLL